MAQGMNRHGNCWDSAPMECLFCSLKTEWMLAVSYPGLAATKRNIGYCLIDYNRECPDAYNKGLAPAVAEEKRKKRVRN